MFEVSKLEFSRWLAKMVISNLSSYEKTMIGIIVDHFDDIASCGTANGRRAKLIGKYIEELGNKADRDDIPLLTLIQKREKVKMLKSLTVENFRGFGTVVKFDFSKKYTFYHGPNGSGKTSFCEAIEYSVLGLVAEAASRGISVEKYIIHSGAKEVSIPKLMCELPSGKIDRFSPSLSTYRFAFIEKNRIIDFSHIGATTARNQTERIAALFGLDEFQRFVHEFTDNFDKRYLTLESDTSQKYEIAKLNFLKKIKDKNNHIKKIKCKKESLKCLIKSLGNDKVCTPEQALEYLADSKTGLITLAIKEASEHHVNLVSEDDVKNLKDNIKIFLEEIKEIKSNCALILSDIGSVNLSALYEAVIELEKNYTETVCPVCRTPLKSVNENPFIYAKSELKKLETIKNAKKKIKIYSQKAELSIQEIIHILLDNKELSVFLGFNVEDATYITAQASDFEIIDSDAIRNTIECVKQIQSKLLQDSLMSQIDIYNSRANNTNKKYDENVALLQKIYREVSGEVSLITELEKQLSDIKKDILYVKNEIRELRVTTKKIEEKINFNRNMVEGYEKIRKKLKSYVEQLPSELAADLSEKVREYYNYINRDDADFELIEELKLPVFANEKIIVRMSDGINQDALHILSEGHVRILGLAILLAKAVREEMPFIVFDDIVNSIDDDHRDGVASLLITHSDFKDMQMILTCHGELFVNSLESYVNDKKLMIRYMFLPADRLEERGVVIKYQDSTIPLKTAFDKYRNGELKDSAAKCRQAVECISGLLWKKLAPSVGGINVKLRNLQGSPDLRSIVDGLKVATKSKNILGVNSIHEMLENLTSMKMWNLLNKGTHVDSTLPEFSRSEIKELLDLLDALNEEVKLLKIMPHSV